MDWADGQLLAPVGLRTGRLIRSLKPVYLPFYLFNASVTTRISNNTEISRYSPSWQEMQVYASYSYKREVVQIAKNLGAVQDMLEPLTPNMLQGLEVDSQDMDPSLARRRIKERIDALERRRVQTVASGDKVNVNVTSMSFKTAYFPVYVLEYRYLSTEFVVMINAVDGRLYGLPQFSVAKVSGLMLCAGTAVLNILQTQGLLQASLLAWIISVLAPSMLTGIGAGLFSRVISYRREKRRVAEVSEDAFHRQDAHESAQDEFRWENKERQGEFKRKRYNRQYAGSRGGSPINFELYNRLELSENASFDEVCKSFRRLALKSHPDLVSDPKLRENATVEFKKLLHAYQVLRDPVKRSKYDKSGL